jgi:hypothetical protein
MEPINMKSGIGTFTLRFAAMAVLFVPAVAAQAQGIGQSICQDVWDAKLFKSLRVCNNVYYPPPLPPPSPQPETPAKLAFTYPVAI